MENGKRISHNHYGKKVREQEALTKSFQPTGVAS